MKKLNEEDIKRKKTINDFIKQRTSIDKDISRKELQEVSVIIKQLNNYIDGSLELSKNDIRLKITRLISRFTINLIYTLDSNIAFRRARKFDKEKSCTAYCFDTLQELSYIPKDKKELVPLGRFNKKEKAIYYASLHYEAIKEEFFHPALSEINAQTLDYINILDSIPMKRLNVVYIGVFDYFIRKQKRPKWIDEFYYDILKLFYNACRNKDNLDLFQSYILSNAFFADIIRRNGSERLYDVTSTVSSVLFENEQTEALVYESVKVIYAPQIAIKTDIVDKHIKHKHAMSLKITNDLGYGIYDIEKVNECTINNNSCILQWTKKLKRRLVPLSERDK